MKKIGTLISFVYFKVTQPSKTVTDSIELFKVRLLVSVLGFFTLLMLALASLTAFAPASAGSQGHPVLQCIIFFTLYLGLFILSKSRFHQYAATIFIAFFMMGVISSILLEPTKDTISGALPYLALVIFVCGLFLSLQAVLIFGLVSLVGIGLLAVFVKHSDLTIQAMFFILSFGINYVTVYLRQKIEEQQKKDQSLLEESERILKLKANELLNAQSLAKIGHWTWNPQKRNFHCSAGALALLELKNAPEAEEFIAMIHPDDLPKSMFSNLIQTPFSPKESKFETEFRLTPKSGIQSGKYFYCLGEIEFDSEGKMRGAAGILQDITERKQMESLRLAKDAAEEANRHKSMFLANISHELRTPMHGVLSFARFGLTKHKEVSAEKMIGYFQEIYDSGSRLMLLLNDLLDLAKLESGNMEFEFVEDDMGWVVKTVAVEMSNYAQEKKLKLSYDQKTTFLCKMDRNRMTQVLRNLISNAIKFSTEGNAIDIELEAKDKMLFCSVINTGIEIPKSELESIFDKFVQSTKTRTTAGGTGLGLSICKEIVVRHGGKIWAESDQNGRTHVIFSTQLL